MKWIPKMISLTLLWSFVTMMVIYVDPELVRDFILPGSYLPFLILLWLAIWYSLAILIRSMTKSLILTTTILLGVFLNIQGLMHWGLMIALLLTLVMESWYTYTKL